MKDLILVFKGHDSFDRPVYDYDGRLFVDTDPRSHHAPRLCTKLNNCFDGEPDTPLEVMMDHEDVEIQFIPWRVVWK